MRGLFYGIGHQPNSSIVEGQIELDEKGYVVVCPITQWSFYLSALLLILGAHSLAHPDWVLGCASSVPASGPCLLLGLIGHQEMTSGMVCR